ncbi:MAG: hypothetical protein AB7S44_03195 [Spirochaetales bacterium]
MYTDNVFKIMKVDLTVLKLLEKQGLNYDNVKNFLNEMPKEFKKLVVNGKINNLGYDEGENHWIFFEYQERARKSTGVGAYFEKQSGNYAKGITFLNISYKESSYFVKINEYIDGNEVSDESYYFYFPSKDFTYDEGKMKKEDIMFIKKVSHENDQTTEFEGKINRYKFNQIENDIYNKEQINDFELQ